MATLPDLVRQQLGPQQIDRISQQIGAPAGATRSAIDAALPMLLGGMASHAAQPQGASAVQQAVQSHENVLDRIESVIGAGGASDGGGLLSHILGGKQQEVHEGVQQASGLDSGQTRKLLMILAPIVLGILARRQQEGAAAGAAPSSGASPATPAAQPHSSGGLAGMLREAASHAAQQAGGKGSGIGGILGEMFGR